MFFMKEYQPNSHAGFYTIKADPDPEPEPGVGVGAETSTCRLRLQP
jgi:hypothetical protein